MGGCLEFEQSGSMLPNGVLPSGVARVTRAIDVNRWLVAEERSAELIALVQPTGVSEERRQAVADYVKRLITKCTSCKVFTYGSVPLKTYLSDGDIDLTAFGEDGSLKDTWANDVYEALENEEKNENAEFHVKEVQYIQAEVKLIKCLIEDIVVDISFNQLGGLCTLCFLDEVDRFVNHDHLFKRSIILAKAWCYYESRILGAHHGLISTYALETLVLYIFHLFNNSFAGPLEVLYRFLEFFSNFDWDNYCISLQGPVPISSLPDMTPQPPRRDSGRLLLNKFYLDAYSATYAVPTISLENKSQPFVSKHFNIVDPLRANNNLGRSVNKGNFFRIRSAFTFGARRLGKLLECSEMDIVTEVDQFFKNTWQRHGTEHCLDATPIMWGTVSVDKTKPHSSIKTTRKHENLFRGIHECNQGLSSDPSCHVPRTIGVNQQSPSTQRKRSTSATYRQGAPMSSLKFKVANAESNNIAKENYLSDDTQKHGMAVLSMDRNGGKKRLHFTRKHSTLGLPCSTDAVLPQDECARVQEARNDENFRYCLDIGSNREKLILGASRNDLAIFSDNSVSSVSRLSQHNTEKSTSSLNTNHDHAYVRPCDEDNASASGLSSVQHDINQYEQEQGLVNMMASCNMHNAKERVPLGINSTSQQPFTLHPFVLMPVGSNGVNTTGVGPPGLPIPELSCASNIHFQQGFASLSYPYLRTSAASSDAEETVDSCSGNSSMMEESGCCNSEMNPIFQPKCANTVQDSQMLHSCGRQEPQSEFVCSSQSSGGKYGDYGESDKLGSVNYASNFPNRNSRHKDAYAPCRNYSVYVPASQVSVSSSKMNSVTSVDGTGRSSIAGREKRGRKVSPSPVLTYLYGRSKSDWPRDSSLGQTSKADYGTLSHSTTRRSSAYGPGKTSGQHSVSSALAVATVERDGRNVAFYPTGPPLPFLTMLPGHNIQSEMSKPRGSTENCHEDVGLGRHDNTSNYNDHSEEPGLREVHVSSALRNNSSEFLEHNLDILNSDFTRHWENLQFARSCQGIHQCGYPSPHMGKPVYYME